MREAIHTNYLNKESEVLVKGVNTMAKRITIETQQEFDELFSQVVPASMSETEFHLKFRLKGSAGGTKSEVMSAYPKEWEKLEAQVSTINSLLISDEVRDNAGDAVLVRVMVSKYDNATSSEKSAFNRVLKSHDKRK
jgi:hypothetical protein|tara:strand:+ start:483 stop:893 length:411 start_codon:yes stop_codon:yes gene_type:complete